MDLRVLKNRAIIKFFESMERWVYRRANLITVHSPGNKDHVVMKGVSPGKVEVMPNWVDTDFIAPGERMNGFREEHNLGDKFVVSFAGVIGYSQDIDVILGAADFLRDRDDILFLIVGDGVKKEGLAKKASSMGLSNVRFLPMQPREKYPSVLAASDVSLVALKKKVVTPVVPSKLLSIMAGGRPVIASLDLKGDAPKIIYKAGCGLAVEPENPESLAEAVLKLYSNPELCKEIGIKGRKYAVENFSPEVCVTKYEELFRSPLRRKGR